MLPAESSAPSSGSISATTLEDLEIELHKRMKDMKRSSSDLSTTLPFKKRRVQESDRPATSLDPFSALSLIADAAATKVSRDFSSSSESGDSSNVSLSSSFSSSSGTLYVASTTSSISPPPSPPDTPALCESPPVTKNQMPHKKPMDQPIVSPQQQPIQQPQIIYVPVWLLDSDKSSHQHHHKQLAASTDPLQNDGFSGLSASATFLAEPLPNGCHSRTSRNHSYCRRTLCYNGSKYCKQHYVQRMRAGKSVSDLPIPPPHVNAMVCLPMNEKLSSLTMAVQDRRFTGGGQPRCQATTTRGRPCAHVAANATRYCNLHHDYDTNPPPKRGAYVRELEKNGQAIDGGIESSQEGTTPSAQVQSPASARTKLLSDISTRHWRGLIVRIRDNGTLWGKRGVIEKWHNGWVSVKMDGQVGIQNRRSSELEVVEEV